MKNDVVVEVSNRDELGKNGSKRLRHRGLIPGVVYGGDREPVAVQLDPRPIQSIVESDRGLNTLIHLRVEGRDLRRLVMLREVQRHPVTERLTHADFFRVEMDQQIDVAVPVHAIGTPLGVKDEGGMLQLVSREVTVRVLPAQIPDSIDIDVSSLHIGQHIEAGDLTLPEGVELLSPPTETIVTVASKVAEELPEAAEEEAEEAVAEGAEGAEEGAETAEGAESE
jgi:large subunit ribosomal protein L25